MKIGNTIMLVGLFLMHVQVYTMDTSNGTRAYHFTKHNNAIAKQIMQEIMADGYYQDQMQSSMHQKYLPKFDSHKEIQKLKKMHEMCKLRINMLKSAIFDAVEKNDLAELKRLVKLMTMQVFDEQGYTPLHRALLYRHYEIAKFIISMCPMLIEVKNKSGQPAALFSANAPDFLNVLLENIRSNSNDQ